MSTKPLQPQIVAKTNLYHNFPTTFDKTIVQTKNIAQRMSDESFMFTAPGAINGTQGIYTVGVTPDGTIFHRCI